MQRKEALYTLVRKWSHYGKLQKFFKKKKLKIELPYDPAISLLGMDSKEIETLLEKISAPLYSL